MSQSAARKRRANELRFASPIDIVSVAPARRSTPVLSALSLIIPAIAILALMSVSTVSAEENAKRFHAISMHGSPKHAEGFEHFDYVNPNAPKGGRVTLAAPGSFDSLNPFIIKGVPAAGLRDFLYESLMTRGLDEPFTLYGQIAEAIEVPEDRSAITFHINPKARFSDGDPIDADDLLFSWKVLRDKGRPNHRAYYAKVTSADRLTDHSVRFNLSDTNDRELPLILGLMPVLPSHLLTDETFDRTTLQAPVGSGPYKITAVDPGRSLTYSRDPDWWGRDLAISKGRFNFDEVRYDYYRESSAMFEAFKAGRVDMRPEDEPATWAEGYNVKPVADGRIIKAEFDIALPAGMTALAFNTRRDQFKDPRVRRALIHLLDFEWINKGLFHGLYTRSESYFSRSALASTGRPADAHERELLVEFPGAVRPEIMDGTYRFPKSDGSGQNRENWREALKLLNDAGYSLKGRKLINEKSGQQLGFEILAGSASQERLLLSFTRDLERLGIAASVRFVDSAQYQSRIKSYDYDMIQTRWPSSLSPGNEQIFRWSSTLADQDGTFNFAGVKSEAVDAMIAAMLRETDAEAFASSVRALDRVLLSGDYVIPLFHLEKQWIAHWHHLRYPENTSLFGYQLDTWWQAAPEDKPTP